MSMASGRRSSRTSAGLRVLSLATLFMLPGAAALAQSAEPSASVGAGVSATSAPASAAPVVDAPPVAPVAPLTQARQRHTATVMRDGSVLFIGGWAHGVGELGSMERYDPTTGTVSFAGDLVHPRSDHSATLLPDGSVLVVGGTTTDTVGLASAELVTPSQDPLVPASVVAVGDLAQGRAHHVAVPVLGDGHVLILGGVGADGPATTAELYDPVTRTFSPVPSLAGDRSGAAAVRLGDAADAQVLITGGHDAQTNLLYDPVSGSAVQLTPLPGHSSPSATWLADGRVLVAGGTQPGDGSAMGTALVWDPTTELQVADLDLATGPRAGHSATVLSDGRVYISGGTGPDGEPLTTAELYDPATEIFAPASAVAGRRFEATVTALGDGNVLVAGGSDGQQTLTTLDLLQPTTEPATVVMRVKPGCDQAKVLNGRGPRRLPVNDETGSMRTNTVRSLQPGAEVTVDREPLAGASYDSSCTGSADYRWYRVRAVNGAAVGGWVTAQVVVGGTQTYPTAPAMLDWADPVQVATVAFDDVTVDDNGVVHAVTATDTGLIYTTNKGGQWTSTPVTHHADKDAASRPAYEGQPSISAADGLVMIAYEDRRSDPIGSEDCAPGPCWQDKGVSVSTLRDGSWTAKQVARSGERPSVVTRNGHGYLVLEDAGEVAYLTNATGAWHAERLKDSPSDFNIPMIAVDSHGRPHIAISQQVSPSRISYAHKQGGSWKIETVAGPSALLSGIQIDPGDVVHIGYTAVRARYPDGLCFEDCDIPLAFHVRSLHGGHWTDVAVPGQGFGVFDVDSTGRPSALRSDAQLAWRAQRSDTWLTRSWKRTWNGPVGSLLEPVRSQWIDVRGDTTYLFYRSTDDATWMITGTLPTS